MARPRVAIIGAGRMGQGLGLALQRRGFATVLYARSERKVAAALALQTGDLAGAVRGAEIILIATPDESIKSVATDLAATDAVTRDQAVLHLSGLLDRTALSPLAGTGAALGSLHPLQAIADPATAPERLQGGFAGIEGDDRGIVAAERLARSLRMTPVVLPAETKAKYHAGAVLIANYTVVLADLARRAARDAGVAGPVAEKIYLPLLKGAVENIGQLGPAAALTGPVRRGDVATIEAHLAALEGETRNTYLQLARASIDLAREAGLSEADATRVSAALDRATGR